MGKRLSIEAQLAGEEWEPRHRAAHDGVARTDGT